MNHHVSSTSPPLVSSKSPIHNKRYLPGWNSPSPDKEIKSCCCFLFPPFPLVSLDGMAAIPKMWRTRGRGEKRSRTKTTKLKEYRLPPPL
ncbi:hypothetical protein CDAR_547271 [Caerostris darwini]|uniref:Uncharacterized protein n=1 Tax=Caerostris darwini TaxID=1538125 RepID=A0AAV4WV67_9ARAC|nr:hypothetical protein CDAR_547271 [Caerostris darwini]